MYTYLNLESGRHLFTGPCTFITAATASIDFPTSKLPEVAFFGRSNVGKSSLINALTGRCTLARVSSTPGHTKKIVFFKLSNRLMLVDLPGYGYTRVSKHISQQLIILTYRYLSLRAMLRYILLLVDGRHGLQSGDYEIMHLIDQTPVNCQLILTKVDQISTIESLRKKLHTEAEATKYAAVSSHVLMTSAKKYIGIPDLRAILETVALP